MEEVAEAGAGIQTVVVVWGIAVHWK